MDESKIVKAFFKRAYAEIYITKYLETVEIEGICDIAVLNISVE